MNIREYEMKKIMTAASIVLLALGFSSAFADMRIEALTGDYKSNPAYPFEGKITNVGYGYQHNEATATVGLADKDNNIMQIDFTGADIMAANALFGSVGKKLVVVFKDTNYTISDFFTYNDIEGIKVHNKFQQK